MSGQPNRNPTDPSKFRQQYLANLALEANINDKNLQANKIYKKTGEVPSQLTDNRTTAEKLADLERLKIDVRSELVEITDGDNANAIVQNLDAQQLQFLAQHIKEIIADIKPKYKYGVPADIFNNYLTAYMRRAIQTDEVNFGLQQTAGVHILLGIQQIMQNMINPQAIQALSQQIRSAHMQGFLNTALLVALQRDLTQLGQIIPDQQFFQVLGQQVDANVRANIQRELNDALQNIPTRQQVNDLQVQLQQAIANRDQARANQIADALHQILQLDPVSVQQMQQIRAELMGEMDSLKDEITGVTEKIKSDINLELNLYGISNQRTIEECVKEMTRELKDSTGQEIAQVVNDLKQKLDEVRDRGERLTRQVVKACVKEALEEAEQRGASTPSRASDVTPTFNRPRVLRISSEDEPLFGLSSSALSSSSSSRPSSSSSSSSRPSSSSLNLEPIEPLIQSPLQASRTQTRPTQLLPQTRLAKSTLDKISKAVNVPTGREISRDLVPYITEMKKLFPQSIWNTLGAPADISMRTPVATLRNINQAIYDAYRDLTNPSTGRGLHRMHGRGLSKKPNVVLQTDFSQGIMPSQKYVPFGRYFIDHHRINDDIFSLRRANGGNIVSLPVRRLSKDLGKVVRTILKNEHPSYNDIDNLTKEEKDYLHKIAKSSSILDRLNIPAPTKEEDDQDINQFEILKGELLCGNDGSETIKKFKVLVMRMMNKGLLPKGQAKEILLDLATMGY